MLVTPDQREEIYSIQRSFNAKIAPLRKQIEDLEATRNKEVESVLDAEQLATVKKLVEEAKAKRAKSAPKKTKAKAEAGE